MYQVVHKIKNEDKETSKSKKMKIKYLNEKSQKYRVP